ncbi:glycoside hydrolase family 20 protein [Runella slithyformis]|uniref:beta-N-acetylhexosaminidase n=1 Tax=Runella slithyformis (strain ATCC 29530 / DSM 19594 / LMG 11500 / NCIMB 11436 / LSU 4) TaxID=761193 RepID=A0A7U3ZJ88_RUNSL|nr:glycoside hydrolase family 20 protein [Runella slithyformis]AEI48246.1 Beta-N-acetylhexosaminidase [Runella slithyformis DSM 19594]
MKRLLVFFTLCTLHVTLLQAQENTYNLIPFPAQFNGGEGAFTLNAQTKIVVGAKDVTLKPIAQSLATTLKTASTLMLPIVATMAPTAKNVIYIRQNKSLGLGTEGYKLIVSADRVTLDAATPQGAFYGLQTILQLLPTAVFSPAPVENVSWSMPVCQIQDKPRFVHRGLMLDVGRHFMPVSFIKKYIDLLAAHKMNVFHWHLTEDQGWRIEIKKYPKLTQVGSKRKETLVGQYSENYPQKFDGKENGGFYTQAEIKDVVKYAQSRYVTIIPEIEMPGHSSAALAAYPELGCEPSKNYQVATKWGVMNDVYCPTEKTFTFLQDVLTEVFALFPGKYIHIGGDEAPKEAWKQSAFCQELIKKLNLKDEHELQSYFIKRIEKFVNSKGRAIIGWDEILEGGIAPNATVMSWRGTQGGIEAAKQKHNVIMTPNTYYYLDYYQANPAKEPLAIGGYLPIEKVYEYDPGAGFTAEEQKYILGIQGNVWTEYMPNSAQVEYMTFPRATAIAEVAWVPSGGKNFEDFATRLKEHLKRLDYLKVNYSKRILDVRAVTQFNNQGQLQVRLEKLDSDSKIYYTTDGKEPSTSSTEYVMPITLDKITTIKAVTTAGARFEEKFFIHRAKGKSYTYANAPAEGVDTDKKKLTDGQVAQSPRNSAEWVRMTGKDFEITIDLGEVKPVTKVSANFLKVIMNNVFPPTSVEIGLSRDGESFKDALAQPVKYALEGPWEIMPVVADFKTARARYIRIRAKNAGPAPEGHPSAGRPTTIAMDEVVVD